MTEGNSSKISWHIHPVKEEGYGKSLTLVSIILIIIILSTILLGALYGALATFILIISLHRYFIKTSYILDDELIVVSTPFYRLERKWSFFKRYSLMSTHIGLSPEIKASRLDNFRGMVLKLPKNEKSENINQFVKNKMEKV